MTKMAGSGPVRRWRFFAFASLLMGLVAHCRVDPLAEKGRPCSTTEPCGPSTVCDPATQTCRPDVPVDLALDHPRQDQGAADAGDLGLFPDIDSTPDLALDLGAPCGPDTCPDGCCDTKGVCRAGNEDNVCGSAGGQCQDCSADSRQCHQSTCRNCATWRLDFSADLFDLELDMDGTAYVVGTASDQVFLAAVDDCGVVQGTRTHLPAGTLSAQATALAQSQDELVVAGTAVQDTGTGSTRENGLLANFLKAGLVPNWVQVQNNDPWDTKLTDVAVSSDGGTLWSTGWTFDDTEIHSLWLAKSSAFGNVCGTDPFALAGMGYRLAMDSTDTTVYFTGSIQGDVFASRLVGADCPLSPCGTCVPTWSPTFALSGGHNEAQDLLLHDGDVFLAGLEILDGADWQGMVLRIDGQSGEMVESVFWNPTAQGDFFQGITTDGSAIFVSGGQGYQEGVSLGQATLARLDLGPLSLTNTVAPGESLTFGKVRHDGNQSLLLVGTQDSAGVMRKCSTDLSCP